MATQEQVEQIIKLFIGYFDRAPAPGGTNYWTGRFEASAEGPAMTWAEIAESFSVQNETTSLYPLLDSDDRDPSQFTKDSLQPFLNDVFMNVLGRPIQEAGLEYYSGQIISGERTVGEAILDIINGANSGTDKQTIDNKVQVSVDVLEKTNAIEGFVFDDEAREVATSLLKDVTSDPDTVAPALAKTEDFVEDRAGSTPGVTINLTTGADQPGGAGGVADTQGTANADTYEAVGAFEVFFGPGQATLNNADSIAAGGGTDTLNLRVVDLQGATTTVSPSATSLENFFVTVQDQSTIYTLDFAAITGEEQVWGVNSGENAAFMASNVDMGTTAGLENYDGFYAINYKGDLSGSNDSFSAVFNGAGDTSTNPAFFATVETNGSTESGFEVVNITSTGAASKVQFDTMSLRDITVTGDAALALFEQSNFAGLESVDASGNTGGTDVSAFNATASNFMFMGSEGNDRIGLSSSLLTNGNDLSLSGGDGKDTLATTTSSSSIASAVNAASGFEVLENVSSSASTLDANAFTNIDEFLFSTARSSGRTNITDAETEDRFVFSADMSHTDETLRFAGEVVGTDITIEVTHEEGSDGTLITATGSSSSAAIGFGDNVDEVRLVSTGATNNANEILATDNGSNNYFAFDNDDGVNEFMLSGDNDLTITAREGFNLNASSDLRGFTESVNFDASDFTGDLRIAGSGTDDAIAGGSGNDIIYGLGGENQLTGNDGSDQFRFSDWFSDSETITDFTVGTDKVGLNEVNFGNTNATAAGTTLSSADYIENVTSIANLSSAEDNTLVELQSGASANQIANNTSSASVDAFVLVYNTDTDKAELWYDSDWSTSGGRNQVVTFDNIESLVDTVGLSNTDFVEYTF